jgi:outer membrane protein TolC
MNTKPITLLLFLSFIGPSVGIAQSAQTTGDSVSLGRLYRLAAAHDARSGQSALNDEALRLRLRNLSAAWLPKFSLTGQARYQSDVPSFQPTGSGSAPEGSFPTVPKDSYEAAFGVRQTLYDAGQTAARHEVERARTEESQAELASTLYALRHEVDAAYFGALALAARIEETALLIADLEARLREARSRAAAGVSLRGEPAAIEAELLRAGQRLNALEAQRRAAVSVLASLTGLQLEGDDVRLPRLESVVASVRGAPPRRLHPAFATFDAIAARLSVQSRLASRQRLPTLAAFGEAGYARPGLNIFGDSWDTYWLGGVRFEWAPWNWGSIGREQELLNLSREAVELENRAFSAMLERSTADVLENIDRLQLALESDDRIIALRETVERQVASQLAEGVVTAAVYVDARNDLLEARLGHQLHLIELAEARAHYLTTVGVDIP